MPETYPDQDAKLVSRPLFPPFSGQSSPDVRTIGPLFFSYSTLIMNSGFVSTVRERVAISEMFPLVSRTTGIFGKVHRTISSTIHYLTYILDNQRFALHLAAVERTVRAAAVTPLPNAPAQVLGMVNVQGRIIPVVSMRRLYGLPERDLSVSDQFIIMRTEQAPVVLVVDEVTGVDSCDESEIVSAGNFMPGLDGIRLIARHDGEIIVLHDPNKLPDLDTIAQLEAALRETLQPC